LKIGGSRTNQERPHSALGYQTPATILGKDDGWQRGGAASSNSEGENSSPTIGCQATIVKPHDGEIGEQSGSGEPTEAIITQKT